MEILPEMWNNVFICFKDNTPRTRLINSICKFLNCNLPKVGDAILAEGHYEHTGQFNRWIAEVTKLVRFYNIWG